MKRWRVFVGEGVVVIEYPRPKEREIVGRIFALVCKTMEEYFEKGEENEETEAMDS